MFDAAIETMEQIMRARPLDARAHYFLGVYLAYKEFNLAVKLRPDYPEPASFLKQIDWDV